MREHLIPRAREPLPIVNSGGAAGGGAQRGRKRVTEGIFLAKIFFFTVLTLLMKRIARMDLAGGFSAASAEVQSDSTQLNLIFETRIFHIFQSHEIYSVLLFR